MNPDPASLDHLRDIVEPGPVSWWPPAAGWWMVFALLAAAVVAFAWRAWRTWRANSYRRSALRELASATEVEQIADILKRTALVAYPRTEVAALSGTTWSQWLGQTSQQDVSSHVTDSLTRGVFGTGDAADTAQLASFVADWIANHKQDPE